jgi:hypothetical protein
MKHILRIFCLTLLILSFSIITVHATDISIENLISGSWYGQYSGLSGDIDVQRYMHMTIDNCDASGNFSGIASVTTVEGQGYDHQWINYKFKGTVNPHTYEFFMQGTEKISSDTTGDWQFATFNGKLQYNENNELYVAGLVDNYSHKEFYFGHVSDWAKLEITIANLYNLIPETMKNKDLSKPITRAEFAAVATRLYEKLTNTQVQPQYSTFIDIAGHPDEESIKKAHTLNVTVGYSDTIFAPNEHISREQLATMLCRAVKKYKYPTWTFATDDQYYVLTAGVPIYADDALISDYAKQSVYYMTKMGIIKGLTHNYFGPKNTTLEEIANNYATATREQAIVMALRIFSQAEKL